MKRSWLDRFYSWFPLVAIVSFAAIAGSQTWLREKPPAEAEVRTRNSGTARTICEAGAWVPSDFFKQQRSLELCQAISHKDYKRLEQLVAESDNLNESERCGVTVLHWAYFERDLTAFEMLLKAGASPDTEFSADVDNSFHPFQVGSTLPLDCMQHRFYGLPFFERTLPYIRRPDQRAPVTKHTLLHAFIYHCFGTSSHSSCETVRQIIATGVEINAQDNHGSTAAKMALGFDMPNECLVILEAGADPDIQDLKGHSLRDTLQGKLAGDQTSISGESLADGLHKIEDWLKNYDSQRSEHSPQNN